MLNQPPVRAHQRNGTIFLKARPPLLYQGGECCSFKSRSSPETGRAPATRLGGELRYLTFTYFRRFCAPTSAAKTEPMLSAAMPDADVPRMTLSRSAGSGMKALSEPSMPFPIMMPLSSPFFAVGSGNEAPT